MCREKLDEPMGSALPWVMGDLGPIFFPCGYLRPILEKNILAVRWNDPARVQGRQELGVPPLFLPAGLPPLPKPRTSAMPQKPLAPWVMSCQHLT